MPWSDWAAAQGGISQNVVQMTDTVSMERKGRVSLIRLNRPEKLNSINMAMVDGLVAAFDQCADDAETRVVILTGSGKAFSAGADVSELSGMSAAELVRKGHMPLWDRLRSFRKPLIAAVNGAAVGGGLELAMACDICIASRSAKFGQAEINLGIMPGAGGTQRLTRALGKSRAMELVLSGKLIDAAEAASRGLVSWVCEDELLMEEAFSLAVQIAERPMFALELAKESVNRAYETTLSQGLELERRNFILSISHPDGKEGISAFLEKRKARWNETIE